MAIPLRAQTANALAAVAGEGRSLDAVLRELRRGGATEREAAFAQQCLYGVLRCWFSLNARLTAALAHPLKSRDLPLQCLILLGLHELEQLSTPAHAVIHETVEACVGLERPWAKGLVNAILRRAQREKLPLPADANPAASFDHPDWLVDRLRADWPQHWMAIVSANAEHPPLTLRVNPLRVSRAEYLATLAAAGIEARATRHSPVGVHLVTPQAVASLPGYAEGWFSVQDEAAQLAAPLLGVAPGDRVLDACAAPGGKTTHLLECEPTLALTAVDVSAPRLAETAENLARLGLQCQCIKADATVWAPQAVASGVRYSRIMLDAPCSAVGVIRRHPDIRLHRCEADLARASARQARLLSALWPLLEPGGYLLYVTCSVLAAENTAVVSGFMAETPDAEVLPIEASWGLPAGLGRQILPGMDGMDGFFFCRLHKTGSA